MERPEQAPARSPMDQPFAAVDARTAVKGRRICIVTSQFGGSGDAAAANAALAAALAADGQTVDVLFLGAEDVAGAVGGVNVILLPRPDKPRRHLEGHRLDAVLVFDWLAQAGARYDAVHFDDFGGAAHHALVGKAQGLCLQGVSTCLTLHGPTAWRLADQGELPSSPAALEIDFMERESARLADAVFAPTAFILDWVRAHGWVLPANVYRQPYASAEMGAGGDHPSPVPVRELAVILRPGQPRALSLALRALSLIEAGAARGLPITLLVVGSAGPQGDLERRAEPWAVHVVADLDEVQALDYLKGEGRLALFPALCENAPWLVSACVRASVPLIAAAVGGIAELVAAEDGPRVCPAPYPVTIARCLAAALENGWAPALPAPELAQASKPWTQWFAQPKPTKAAPAAADPTPLVSVCVTHFNRPQLLRQAIESLEAQDYPNFEVVLLDSSGPRPETLACLDSLRPRFEARGWRIVLDEDRYLGAARNAAASHARGDFILFMDDDNLAKPDEISTFVRAALHSGADVLTCANSHFRGEGGPPDEDLDVWVPLGGALGAGGFGNCFGDANAFLRKGVLEAVGGFSEMYGVGHDDWELFARVVAKGFRLQVVPRALYWYRFSATAMSLEVNQAAAGYQRSLRPITETAGPDLGLALQLGLQTFLDRAALRAENEALWAAVREAAGDDLDLAELDDFRRIPDDLAALVDAPAPLALAFDGGWNGAVHAFESPRDLSRAELRGAVRVRADEPLTLRIGLFSQDGAAQRWVVFKPGLSTFRLRAADFQPLEGAPDLTSVARIDFAGAAGPGQVEVRLECVDCGETALLFGPAPAEPAPLSRRALLLRKTRTAVRLGRQALGRMRRLAGFARRQGPGAALSVILVKAGLRPPPAAPGSGAFPHDRFDVVMFIGCWEGESKRYRVYNVAEALALEGYSVKIHPASDCRDMVLGDWKARTVVFFRAPYEEGVGLAEVLAHARRQGARVVFDVDDLVFEPGLVDQIHGVARLSPEEQVQYMDGVLKYRRMLLASDAATVTTPTLARAVEALGRPAAVIPNGINQAQIDAAEALVAAGRPGRERLRVGYFSGSRTHERDFACAEPALLQLMRERPDWDLVVVGYLDLGPAWDGFADRVVRRPFMAPLDMLAVLAECDVNLAPLEIGDAFCEAKSELKFFEAALVETPTIASATEPFRAVVADGVDGALAAAAEDWRRWLGALLGDMDLRRRMGRRARQTALRRFGVEAVAAAAKAALLPRARASEPALHHPLRIDWVVPRLIIGGGGHRNILRAAHHLQTFGHDVCLHFTNSDDQAPVLRRLVVDHFYPFEGGVRAYDGRFRRSDVIMATHWTTVDAALRARDRTGEVMYFVQDFEPAFAPMGSEYVLAENTYRQGLYCITSGPWCERLLKKDYGCEADHFRFPVDRDIYRPRRRTKANRNIVFFAKPDMPRRCFEIGAMALAHFHRARPDVEIIMFGSKALDPASLGFKATTLDIVPTLDDLAQMYANADLGLVFSTTNPSLVPYEMMASGCVVVDLDRPGNEYNYDDRRDIALLADPMPEVMAAQIQALLENPSELAERRRNGLAFADTFPDELAMARRVEALIAGRLAKGTAGAFAEAVDA